MCCYKVFQINLAEILGKTDIVNAIVKAKAASVVKVEATSEDEKVEVEATSVAEKVEVKATSVAEEVEVEATPVAKEVKAIYDPWASGERRDARF